MSRDTHPLLLWLTVMTYFFFPSISKANEINWGDSWNLASFSWLSLFTSHLHLLASGGQVATKKTLPQITNSTVNINQQWTFGDLMS
jgi:hypothetical protein